jgi:pimeloyl-ACP methyl ester carboxylesterase
MSNVKFFKRAGWRARRETIDKMCLETDMLDFVEVAPEGARSGRPWRIARRLRAAAGEGKAKPGLVWLAGFRSDMLGRKARFLDERSKGEGRACLRFDYSGHGESEGLFEDGAIGDWLEQSVRLFDVSTQGPQILVGSSMGAWIALLLARRLAQKGETYRLKALVLIAPAVDFTEELIWKNLGATARWEIIERGVWMAPSPYGTEPTPITRRLIEEARAHLLLGDVVQAHAPVHILQGLQDQEVPWRHAAALMERLANDHATISYIRDGDHRLSRDEDLERLAAAIDSLS